MNKYHRQTNSQNPNLETPPQTPVPPRPNTQLYGEQPLNVQPRRPVPTTGQATTPNTVSTNGATSKHKPNRWNRFKGIFSLVQIVGGAIAAALIINTVVFQSYEVVGDSMRGTLTDGDRLIVNKLGKSTTSLLRRDFVPKRGDIIVFNDPNGSKRQLVKRVIGIPGDTIIVSKGVITVFNEEQPTGFNPDLEYADTLTEDTNYSLREEVGDGLLFVAGDNRIGGASLDSRNDLGLVPTKNIIGDLIMRLLPLSNSRFF